jgi:hypothetical protein
LYIRDAESKLKKAEQIKLDLKVARENFIRLQTKCDEYVSKLDKQRSIKSLLENKIDVILKEREEERFSLEKRIELAENRATEVEEEVRRQQE